MKEKQTYELRECKLCAKDTTHISTLSPKGSWVCCMCRTKSGRNWDVEWNEIFGEFRFIKRI